MATLPLTLDDVNLLDHDLFAEREPWDVFELLQREAPVFRHPEPDGDGFWCVTRYDDVVQVLKDTATFSSEAGGAALIEPVPEDVLEARRNFMETDPPLHSQWRRMFARDFTPRSLADRYSEYLAELTRAMLDETLPKGEFCFVEEIAGPIPIRVLGHMLGVPDEHLDKLVELGDRMLVPTDPDLTPPTTLTPEQSKYLPFGSEAGAELLELGRPLITERKGHPCGDVLSILANAEIGGCPVSQHDLDNNLALLVVAGNETTRQGMALGMLALMEHPDEMELLRSDPSLMPTAVDELIRYASPVWHFRRTAVADTELRGVEIRKGERVVVWFAAANRDPDAFPDPHRLDLRRKRDVHAAFGRGGPHFCLGAHLARLEMAVLFEQLLPRLASIELTGPPARLRSNFTNGLKRLPVRVVERRAG
jgi:cytochrome P450